MSRNGIFSSIKEKEIPARSNIHGLMFLWRDRSGLRSIVKLICCVITNLVYAKVTADNREEAHQTVSLCNHKE